MKGVMRLDKKEKLAPRYIETFGILEKINMVAYRLALPPDMSQVYPVSHVSMLRKYISDPSHLLQPHSMDINEDLTYKEKSVTKVDFQIRQLRSKIFLVVKVLWRSSSVEEHRGKIEAEICAAYPYLFLSKFLSSSFSLNSRTNFYKRGRL